MPSPAVRACSRVADPLRPIDSSAGAEAAISRMLKGRAQGHPDAELIKLWERCVAATEARYAAGKRVDACAEVTIYPDPPEALFLRQEDHALQLARYASERHDGQMWYRVDPVDAERPRLRKTHLRWQERPVTPADGLPPDAHTIVERVPWPEAQARADEIVLAWDRYQQALDELERGSGIEAANEEWERLADEEGTIKEAIWVATAHTLQGVIIKARLMQVDLDEGSGHEPRLIQGLVRDILALGGAQV